MESNVRIMLLIAAISLSVAAFIVAEDPGIVKTVTQDNQKPIDRNPPCLQMHRYITQYADSFDIPLRYAFGIANAETSYKGPFDWKYNPAQTSCAGAVGPMQVMVSTARHINKDTVSKEELCNNIEYNVCTSMKLLRILYNKRHDWKIVFGEYNTGRPCINGYSNKVYNYQPKW